MATFLAALGEAAEIAERGKAGLVRIHARGNVGFGLLLEVKPKLFVELIIDPVPAKQGPQSEA